MAQSFFEEIQAKKQNLLAMAEQAAEYGWIPEKSNSGKTKDVISLEEIKDKINKDTLTIGVIGQMKCGKSTFLNSFVFEENILPAATTPMTAALSVITYGEKEKIVAEFYTKDEWEEQLQQASRSLEDVANTLEESKVKAAKELVSKATKLGSSLNDYLGKTQEDEFSNLIEYVGADGKFISITKSVTIYYPKEYLKGVEIVDTPGFNDPIVSREERTKEFLKKADVVLMMLYAGRPFDATDRDIIFQNVRQCGIGKVLIGINKYDIPFCSEKNPEDEEQIKAYVKEEIRKACRECNDSTLNEILNEAEPIPISAEMALLSELPMSAISGSSAFDFAWKRHCKNFGIGSQREMRAYSHIDDLTSAIKELVAKEKDRILFAKPLNAIFAAGEKKKSEYETELILTKKSIEEYSLPDSELIEREEQLSKAKKRLTKKIDSLGEDIETDIQNIIRKGKNDLEDLVDASCKRMASIVQNEWKVTKSFDSIRPAIEAEQSSLVTRKLKRATEDIAGQGKKKIDGCINEFFADVEELLMKHLPDFDSRQFVKQAKNEVTIELDSKDLFDFENGDTEEVTYGFWDGVYDFMKGASFGTLDVLVNTLSHNENVSAILSEINKINSGFDPVPYLESAFHSKDQMIELIKNKFISDLIEPMQEDISKIRTEKAQRESNLQNCTKKKDDLMNKLNAINEQYEAMNKMRS